MDVIDVWCAFGWKIVVYNTIAFSECITCCPHGGYVCFVAFKVMKIFLLGLPYKVGHTVPLFLLLLPKFVPVEHGFFYISV